MKKLLLVVLALVVSGCVVFGAYKVFSAKDNSTNTSAQPTPSTTTEDKWFEIPEWGVKFKLPADVINDYQYRYDSSIEYVVFSSKQLGQKYTDCDVDHAGIRAYTRQLTSTPRDKVATEDSSNFKQIEGYIYSTVRGSTSCDYQAGDDPLLIERIGTLNQYIKDGLVAI